MTPEWPPTTVTLEVSGLVPLTCETKVAARTTSRVVTPNSRLGSKTPAFLKTSATMGTVEFTGFEMISMWALGALLESKLQSRKKRRTQRPPWPDS